jgi:hypothetical protein
MHTRSADMPVGKYHSHISEIYMRNGSQMYRTSDRLSVLVYTEDELLPSPVLAYGSESKSMPDILMFVMLL